VVMAINDDGRIEDKITNDQLGHIPKKCKGAVFGPVKGAEGNGDGHNPGADGFDEDHKTGDRENGLVDQRDLGGWVILLEKIIQQRRDEEKEEMVDFPGVIDPDMFVLDKKAGRIGDQKHEHEFERSQK
jgi:hypothetical protein